jgi:hypothetical protein
MASSDLQQFLEDRLVALIPGIDLSAGSPAQTKFVSPILTYLGTDPFDTDIGSFILDRFAQDYPDIYASDPGALRDLFVKPLQLILEPLKREIQTVRRNQSLIDPSLLSDEDADALVANVFDSRDTGGYANGVVRAYFPTPIDINVELATRIFDQQNQSFFPTNQLSLSSELMAFNREGSLFYADIPVRAEKPGASYNIAAGQIAGVEGLPNVVRATNLRKFANGAERQDNTTFVAAAESSLSERSLSNRRGAVARLNTVFKGQLRSTQVIGSKDPEMQRDLLVTSSPGHTWITGYVTLYKNVAFVLARTLEGKVSEIPKVGDTLYIYLQDHGTYGVNIFGSVRQENRLVRLKEEYAYSYFVRWSDSDGALQAALGGDGYATFTSLGPWNLDGGFARVGTIRISAAPDAGDDVNTDVPDGSVHVYGHADIYVRPTVQSADVVSVNGVYDLGVLGASTKLPHFSVEREGLRTVPQSVIVTEWPDSTFDYVTAGVMVGDVLSIETGPDAGLYNILAVAPTVFEDETRDVVVDGSYLSLDRHPENFGTARYRIVRTIRIDPFAPTIHKFPFGDIDSRRLNTNINDKRVTIPDIDLRDYGAIEGDTLAILSGPDIGTYKITAFDPVLGGSGVYLDRALTSTGANLDFEVYTALNPVQKPLVRIKEILLLDSSQQSTGVTVPSADPVAVTPVGAFSSAGVLGASKLSSGYVLPDLAGLLVYEEDSSQPVSSIAGPSTTGNDARYSMGFDTPDGVYIPMAFEDGTRSELDFRSDTSGKTSFFLATVETDNDDTNYPPVDPKPGECLTLKSGPNKGDYLIKAVHKFKYRTAPGNTVRTMYCYFIQIYGTFPVDPFKDLIDFIKYSNRTTGLKLYPGMTELAFPGFFVNFYNSLPSTLGAILTDKSADAAQADIKAVVDSMCSCQYEWGAPARGTLRTFYREPTLFEQNTGAADVVTTFSCKGPTGEAIRFRPDPARYQKYEIIPPRVGRDAEPTEYPTDLVTAVDITVSAETGTLAIGQWLYGSHSHASGRVSWLYGSVVTLSPVFGTFTTAGNEHLYDTLTGTPTYTAAVMGIQNSPVINTSTGPPTLYSMGVRVGDFLSINEELPLLPSAPASELILRTTAGSPIVKLYDLPATAIFDSSMTGGIVHISQGDDAGNYRVVKVIDGSTLLLDRVLTTTTAFPINDIGHGGRYGDGAVISTVTPNVATLPTLSVISSDVGSYLTLYGIDYRWVGSFKILSVNPTANAVDVTFSSSMTAFDALMMNGARWVVIADPGIPPISRARGDHNPATPPKGTDVLGGVPFRIYDQTGHDFEITSLWPSDTVPRLTLVGGPTQGIAQPYRVYRKNLRRLTPSEMGAQRHGFLCYFDTEVVSLSPATASNVSKDTYLLPDAGTYRSLGYRHVVADSHLSYSTKETGFLDLPTKVMTDSSLDSPDSLISIVGAPIQITYERADLVERVQEFADSASDRPIAGNLLVRHFLPAYTSYDATYLGGSDPSVVAKDIQTYLDQLPIETSADISEIEKLITGRGGNPITPTTLMATIYDWDRRAWVEFSENYLGGPNPEDTKVPYNGSPRVTFFLPSPDVSGQDPLPSGERINLVRQ